MIFVFGALMFIQTNNAQYFSTSDGATLSRIGKRNYLYKIIYMRRPPSHHHNQAKLTELDQMSSSNLDTDGLNLQQDELSSNSGIKENSNLNSLNKHESFNQVDKLSHVRKLHNKFGKRFSDDPESDDDSIYDEQDYNVQDSDEDFSNENSLLSKNQNNQSKYKQLITNLMNEYKENLKRPFKNQLD
jgi:hypothetical protein